MSNAIFITGATGMLGTQLVQELACRGNEPIFVLVRAENEQAACHRLKAVWYGNRELYDKIGSQIIPVAGDLTKKNLGMDRTAARRVIRETGMVFHTAAEVGLQKDPQETMRINRQGTARLLAMAEKMPHLQRFVHVSTAYVAGTKTGVIREEDPVGRHFSSVYERSKAEAEKLVRKSGLPFSICRPGMIVGHSKTGCTRNFNTIYYMLRLFLTGKLPVIPVGRETRLNVVPVDYVAEAVADIGFAREGKGRTFHLTCPRELQPQVGELTEYVRLWAEKNLNVTLRDPAYVPAPGLEKAGILYNTGFKGHKKGKTGQVQKNMLTNLLAIAPYFSDSKEFDRTQADRLTGPYTLRWRDYIDPLLTFACRKNFMTQSGRTVFEQAAVRNASRRYPVRYYDVTADGIVETDGPEVNERIARIVRALRSHGIRKGDRVALTGINSVDYMTIDQAIGWIGAVSVPIYYTTPVREVQQLLDRSGARWLFVGDRRIMRQIELLDEQIHVVAFSDGLTVPKPGVKHWEQFLYETEGDAAGTRNGAEENEAAGSSGTGKDETPDRSENGKDPTAVEAADPEDLATIRYTSGTTGDPKGVQFDFGQLAWMGEVLTNLLPWEDRNRSMRYLSFLPLSHVVEGILASYAPYYVLADVDFYFLNDFGSLTEALPKVRPNVFFSVPRFYEKLWAQLEENRFGQAWIKMKDGPAKEKAAGILRKIILKKAGLDACRQLIVGSAPISEELLRKFRSLGIEIYNAYGQAEAPLITINRLHDNVIPTIGTPLPETEVTIAPDGELIVKGPQVCRGYYGLETDTIKDGVLKTGDLGRIDETGHVTLFGRKKEMIITAYGKNISIPKVEERIKDIPGVSEAVLIGEKRPYCTALIWLERDTPDLKERIDRMNENLSHPEQIRRFTVIDTPLRIDKGELTPNLKIRRGNVEEHYREEIDRMYQ